MNGFTHPTRTTSGPSLTGRSQLLDSYTSVTEEPF